MKFTRFLELGLVLLGGGLGCTPAGQSNGTADELKTLVEGNNQFALDLYARLSQEKGNIIFSPYSISNALAMTYAGARGETAAEMAKVLHFTLGQERLHEAFGSLIDQLEEDPKTSPYQLNIANSLWVQQGFPLEQMFLQINRKNYGTGLKEVNFKGQPEEARKIINSWVEEKTKDKIKELLHREDVDSLTRLILTNAIYFKANWQFSFAKDQTKDEQFEVAPDVKVSVPMMHYQGEIPFKIFVDEAFQWLELPYQGQRLSMVILLPRNKGQLAELEKSLTASAIQIGLSQLQKRKIQDGTVALPRFKMTLRFPLADELKEMGMKQAFSDDADFTGIAPSPRLIISKVIHKAYIDVDEVGTEAAAATGVIFSLGSALVYSFRADHPFLFLIREERTGSILFMGRVSDPR